MADIKGQINRQQATATFVSALAAGALAALVVIQAELPAIVDTLTPLGIAISTALVLAIKFLKQGQPVDSKRN